MGFPSEPAAAPRRANAQRLALAAAAGGAALLLLVVLSGASHGSIGGIARSQKLSGAQPFDLRGSLLPSAMKTVAACPAGASIHNIDELGIDRECVAQDGAVCAEASTCCVNGKHILKCAEATPGHFVDDHGISDHCHPQTGCSHSGDECLTGFSKLKCNSAGPGFISKHGVVFKCNSDYRCGLHSEECAEAPDSDPHNLKFVLKCRSLLPKYTKHYFVDDHGLIDPVPTTTTTTTTTTHAPVADAGEAVVFKLEPDTTLVQHVIPCKHQLSCAKSGTECIRHTDFLACEIPAVGHFVHASGADSGVVRACRMQDGCSQSGKRCVDGTTSLECLSPVEGFRLEGSLVKQCKPQPGCKPGSSGKICLAGSKEPLLTCMDVSSVELVDEKVMPLSSEQPDTESLQRDAALIAKLEKELEAEAEEMKEHDRHAAEVIEELKQAAVEGPATADWKTKKLMEAGQAMLDNTKSWMDYLQTHILHGEPEFHRHDELPHEHLPHAAEQ